MADSGLEGQELLELESKLEDEFADDLHKAYSDAESQILNLPCENLRDLVTKAQDAHTDQLTSLDLSVMVLRRCEDLDVQIRGMGE